MGHLLRSWLRIVRDFLVTSFRILRYVFWTQLVWRWWLGYGERPERVVLTATVALVGTWLGYWQLGMFVIDSGPESTSIGQLPWDSALYFSLVSFSALGYGSWAPEPVGWAKWVGAVQPIVGITSVVALSISLTQRVNR